VSRDAYSTIKLTILCTSGPIKIIDKKTKGQPNMKLDGHLSRNILVDGVLINVITPLTNRAVFKDIKNAKITILYWLASFFILVFYQGRTSPSWKKPPVGP
jgi:hypothetical protein